MEISVSDAKAQLTDLVRRAESGEEVVLTRHGQPAAKIVSVKPKPTAAEKHALITRIMEEGSKKALPGPCAARSQDYLYGDDGLPA
ncbi:MAG: type II toxin-antitoxin system prevent-host-death family antitoxin [Rhizobiaceae bacterium]|nr:type II toxin-antitoxin system prevent-host-death family antitoxin [Rhizobiaceae bacterium]